MSRHKRFMQAFRSHAAKCSFIAIMSFSLALAAGCQSGSEPQSGAINQDLSVSAPESAADNAEPASTEPGSQSSSGTIVYEDTQYGFTLTLPDFWENYSVVDEEWEGNRINQSGQQEAAETGPQLLIRHPLWTSQSPRQDIPVMVFTLEQWDALSAEKFHIGAAPVGPSELGRNSQYVFALPARYNFAYQTGYEEVEEIITSQAFQANENMDG